MWIKYSYIVLIDDDGVLTRGGWKLRERRGRQLERWESYGSDIFWCKMEERLEERDWIWSHDARNSFFIHLFRPLCFTAFSYSCLLNFNDMYVPWHHMAMIFMCVLSFTWQYYIMFIWISFHENENKWVRVLTHDGKVYTAHFAL